MHAGRALWDICASWELAMFPPGSGRLLLCEADLLHKVCEQSFLLNISPYQGSFSSTASFSLHFLLKMIEIKKDSLYLKFFLQNMVY